MSEREVGVTIQGIMSDFCDDEIVLIGMVVIGVYTYDEMTEPYILIILMSVS